MKKNYRWEFWFSCSLLMVFERQLLDGGPLWIASLGWRLSDASLQHRPGAVPSLSSGFCASASVALFGSVRRRQPLALVRRWRYPLMLSWLPAMPHFCVFFLLYCDDPSMTTHSLRQVSPGLGKLKMH
jgi:hypothetical protein